MPFVSASQSEERRLLVKTACIVACVFVATLLLTGVRVTTEEIDHAARALATVAQRQSDRAARARSPVASPAFGVGSDSIARYAARNGANAMRPGATHATAADVALASLATAEEDEMLRHSAQQRGVGRPLVVSSVVAVLLVLGIAFAALRLRRRHAAEMHAVQSEFRQRSAGNPDAVLVHRDGRIVFSNAAADRMFGLPTGQMENRELESLVHPDDRHVLRARASGRWSDASPAHRRGIRYLRADGMILEAEGRGAPMRFDGRDAVEVVLRDLSAQREAERALAISEARLRTLLDAMNEGVVMHDAALAITLWNPAAERILELSGDALAARTPCETEWRSVDENGEDSSREQFFSAVALRTGKPASGVKCVQRADGATKWMRVDAVPLFRDGATEPYAVVATLADVTEERRAAERLRESESRYRLLAENSADLIALWTPDQRFRYASPSHLDILGWAPEELLGESARALLHPDDADRVATARALQWGDGAHFVLTARARHKAGHYVWLEIAATLLTAPDGTPDGFRVSARDVTTRLALEEKLGQSKKMAVMGRMASGVAHDFNNILTVIRSSAELLRLEHAARGTSLTGLSDIEAAADRGAALTSHLLTFSRRQPSAPVPLQTAPTIQDAFPILTRIVGSGVSVKLEMDPTSTDAWIGADPERIERVLVNLVSNASDAMPAGGDVRVTCAAVELKESLTDRFGVIPPGRYVTLSVEDTGLGMSDDVLSHLFDPFYTTKRQGRGTGLGLSVVYGIVTDARGAITVQSQRGSGSRFTVYWPRVEAPAAEEPTVPRGTLRPAAAPVAITAAGVPGSTRPAPRATRVTPVPTNSVEDDAPTVILVDDDDNVRSVLARQLEASGFHVHSLSSGAAALALLRNENTTAHALVSDVRMPEMTGVELVDAMLAAGIDLPVLLISGQMDAQLPHGWLTTPQRRFLPKPISGVALRRALDEVLTASRMQVARA